jgi:hypothetical protein
MTSSYCTGWTARDGCDLGQDAARVVGCVCAQPYDPRVSDAEHELLVENTAHVEEIARLRAVVLRAAHAAITAQDRADGGHEAWLDELLDELHATGDA